MSLDVEDPALKDVAAHITSKAYPNAITKQRVVVLINPHGGKGAALNIYQNTCKPILEAAEWVVDIQKTQYQGHAIEIAKNLDVERYSTIICASGDGIPHEVINGLFMRQDRVKTFSSIAVSQLPCGSGNAMSISCHGTSDPSRAALALVKGHSVPMDLMAVTQMQNGLPQTRLSFLSQTYGIIADSDIGTEFLRWMGPSRFELGVFMKVLMNAKYPCEIAVKYQAKSKQELTDHYQEYCKGVHLQELEEKDFELKYPNLDTPVPNDWEYIDDQLTCNLGIFYVGKMPYIAPGCQFFPAALPADGTMDLVITDSRTNIIQTANVLTSLDSGAHVMADEVVHSKILAYRLTPRMDHSYISVDGESFPFLPTQAEILPGLMRTIMNEGSFIETSFER